MSWNVLYATVAGPVSLIPGAGSVAFSGYAPNVFSGTGVIPAALAAMSAGAYQSVTLPEVWTISNNPGSSIFEFTSRAFFDRPHNKIRFVGIQHNAGWAQYCDYNISTDTAAQELIPDGRTDPRHAYAGCDCDPSSGTTYYWQGQDSSTMWVRTNAGSWSSISNGVGPDPNAWSQVAWSPALSALVWGSIWAIGKYSGGTSGTYSTLLTSSGGTQMSDETGVGAYNSKDSCAYVGCSISSNPACYKVTSGGVASAISLSGAPTLAVQSSGNNFAMLLAAGNSANDMLAVKQDGTGFAYNSSGNSWSSFALNASLISFLQGANNNQWIAGAIYESSPGAGDGGQFFIREHPADTMDSTVWLHKY